MASLVNVKYIYSVFPCFLLKGWLHKWSGSLEDEGLIKFYCQSELNFGLLPLPQMGHFTTVDFSIVINLPNNFLNSGSPLNKYKIVTRFFSLLLSKVKETVTRLRRQLSMKTAWLRFTPFLSFPIFIVQRAGPYLLFARQDVLFPAPGKIYDESGRGLPEVRHYSQC